MADEATGIVPRQSTDLVGDSSPEPREPKTVAEIIAEFAQRRDRITILQNARILFDPKSLPGVTPKEAMEFLLKGLKIDDLETREKYTGAAGVAIRYNFHDFIDALKQQNNDATVSDIWDAADADPFTKMALQWEIQTEHQLMGDFIEESAAKTAADLRKLDKILKKSKGAEILVVLYKKHSPKFKGLTVANDEGLDFVRDSDNALYRSVVFGGQAAYIIDDDLVQRSDHLMIPFEAREALWTVKERYWENMLSDNGFYDRGREKFDPGNNFASIVMGEDLSRMLKERGLPGSGDPAALAYDKLTESLKGPKKSTVV